MSPPDVPPIQAQSATGADAYDVRERIAIGAAAVVYHAVHLESGQHVLFKVLQADEITNPLDVSQVLKQKEHLAAVRHPNVAELMDVIEDEEGCVLIYSYLAGKGANKCPSEQDFSPAQALEIARQLCAALVAGEQANVPHGELKPSNIVIARQGGVPQVQVQDWGLAACRLGAPPYESLLFMAPERLSGAPPSFSSDLFSLGATLVFLFTGHIPVHGSTGEELQVAWRNFDPADVAAHRPDLDPVLIQWLGWLLSLPPAARPATAAQAALALHSGRIPKPGPATRGSCSSGPITQPLPKLQATASGSPTVPLSRPPKPAYGGVAQKVLSVAFYLSVTAAAVVLTLCGLEFHFGRGWVAMRWQDWRDQKALAKVSAKQNPLAAAVAAAQESTPFSGSSSASPEPTPLSLSEPFGYALDASLNSENGGQGWSTAWNADNVVIGKTPDGRHLFAMMGASAESHARRGLGPARVIAASPSLAVSVSLWFPLEDGPTLKVDLLDGSSDSAPVKITPKGSRIQVTLSGGQGELEMPAGRLWRLGVTYAIHRTRTSAVDVEITALASTDLRNGHLPPNRPVCRRMLRGISLPENLWINFRTEGAAPQDCQVSDLRVAHSLREALR